MPADILFGIGAVNDLAAEIKKRGCKKPLIVTDKNIKSIIERVTGLLQDEDISAAIYDEVVYEPTLEFVIEGLNLYKENNCDSVIALGGGSCIDAAKGVAVMATNPGEIELYKGNNKIKEPAAPLIAIPTTAGTASEVSLTIVLTDTKYNDKFIINDPKVIPILAIEDPELTVELPASVTAYSGIDALTHAIEGFIVNRPANMGLGGESLTDVAAREAIRLISTNIRTAHANGKDIEARYNMMLGQLLAGMTFSNSGTALVHGLARPLGAYFHVPHGLANAIMLPIGMEFTWQGCPDKCKEIAFCMGEEVKDLPVNKASELAVQAIRKLCEDLNIPRLSDLDITKDALEKVVVDMATNGFESGTPKANPRKPKIEEMVEMYWEAF